MSNRLKTLSKNEIEHFIAEKFSAYIDEDCSCSIQNLSTPNINSEEDIVETNERSLTFDVKLSYKE